MHSVESPQYVSCFGIKFQQFHNEKTRDLLLEYGRNLKICRKLPKKIGK